MSPKPRAAAPRAVPSPSASRVASPVTPPGFKGMRESYRWLLVILLVCALSAFSVTIWQVRQLRWSLNYLQGQLDLTSAQLQQAKVERDLARIERDEAKGAYAKLLASLPSPMPPAPPHPIRAKKRPTPVFSRDSQFVAKQRRRVAHFTG